MIKTQNNLILIQENKLAVDIPSKQNRNTLFCYLNFCIVLVSMYRKRYKTEPDRIPSLLQPL